MSGKIDISEQIMGQARAWYVRLGDEQAGADDWALFTDWLEESPVHVEAYDQVELALVGVTSTFAAQDDIAQENIAQDNPDNVIHLKPDPKKKPHIVWRRYAGIAALFLAALTVFYTYNPFQSPSVQTYATKIGGHKEIVLTDGTHIQLNTNTQISVAMNKKTRTVTLASGEAFFDIAKDKKRPFIVNAMDTKITDIGTSFSVYTGETALTVSVADGIVDMQNKNQTTRLIKGQQAVQRRGDNIIKVSSIDIDNISTWRNGVLVFEDTKLSTIIPELNRYFKIPMTFTDENVASLTFSGVLNISNQNTLLASMEALMPIKADYESERILLSYKN